MAFDKDAFLTALDSMTVLELNDLVKAIEEKFGVCAAAMAAPAAGATAGLDAIPDFSYRPRARGAGREARWWRSCTRRRCTGRSAGRLSLAFEIFNPIVRKQKWHSIKTHF